MYYFIANPKAGKGLGLKVMQDLEQYLNKKGVIYETAYTQYAGHAIELARDAVGEGHRLIVAVGGDGTVLEVSSGIIQADGEKTALAIIPAGTGNDFAKGMGIPRDPELAVDTMLAGHYRNVDMALVNGRYYLNIAGLGFDVECILKTERTKKMGLRGSTAYYCAVLIATLSYKWQKVRITMDGDKVMDREVLMVSVANGQYQGGGMHSAPQAKLDDGLLDLMIINRLPRLQIYSLLPRYVKGTHLTLKMVENYQCKTVKVESVGSPAPLNMDGEVTDSTPAEFKLADKKLMIFAPEIKE